MLQTDDTTRDMLGRSKIIFFNKALSVLQKQINHLSLSDEIIPIQNALGRITSINITAPENLPSYSRSTMDGFAVRASDVFGATASIPAYMEITGEVQMGDIPLIGPAPGTCFRISTGGLMPPGTDAVIMLEHTINIDSHMVEIVQGVASGVNVIDIGEDIHIGEIQIYHGHRLRPQDLGLLAGLGIKNVSVKQKVNVGIISTGDEIIPFDHAPSPGKIRDINSIAISGLVREIDGIPIYYGIVPDKESKLYDTAQKAMAENDIIIFSGSSSVGTRDIGSKVIESLGTPGIIVHGVAIKPGKPVIIALCNGKPVFGLPGHPVSAMVCFEMFVEPVIKFLSGKADSSLSFKKNVRGILMKNIPSTGGRRDFIRVEVKKGKGNNIFEVHPIFGKSGAISTLVKANGYVVIEESLQGLKQGDEVKVQLFQ